jgi:hypothetical protein
MIESSIWEDEKFCALSVEAKLLFIYLFSSPHRNMVGLYRLTIKYISSDTGFNESKILELMKELISNGMVSYLGDYVLVKKFLKYNPLNNEKQAKGAIKRLSDMKLGSVNPALVNEFLECVETHCKHYLQLFDTLLIPYRCPIDTLSNGMARDIDVPYPVSSNSIPYPVEGSLAGNAADKPPDEPPPKSDVTPYEDIKNLFLTVCVSYPKIQTLSAERKKAIHARWVKYHDIDKFKELFEKAEASEFLKGTNPRNWSATFDWLLNDDNMTKTLEGNYDNKSGNSTGPGAQSTGNRFADRLREKQNE